MTKGCVKVSVEGVFLLKERFEIINRVVYTLSIRHAAVHGTHQPLA